MLYKMKLWQRQINVKVEQYYVESEYDDRDGLYVLPDADSTDKQTDDSCRTRT